MRAVAIAMLAGMMLFAQGATAVDDVTRAALANRVEGGHTVGVEVGLATTEGRAFAVHGLIAKGGTAPTKDTVFEIGSITKVFTAGRPITLADLTTHASGLPRLPTNLETASLDNPYATYDVAKLYAFLSGYQLTREPGAQWEYSNLGAGLLGHVLTRRTGLSYEQLVKTRILDPLGMKNTSITLTPAMRQRLATAHDESLSPVSLWDLDALAGAGALRSTADDLLTFAAANAGLIDTPLKSAMERMRALRRRGRTPAMEQAMGWLVIKPLGSELFLHDGGTHGFRSAIVVDPAHKRAAIAFSIAITREGGRLFEQATGQSRLEIFPEKKDEFFLRTVKAQLSFVRDDSGHIVALVLHQNGIDQRAPKVK